MFYKYETHLHTSEVSKCARSTGAEMARAFNKAGYAGIFVTDHFLMEIVLFQRNWTGNSKWIYLCEATRAQKRKEISWVWMCSSDGSLLCSLMQLTFNL